MIHTTSKVTIGFKVTPSKKLEIATTAEKLGMNTAQYLEAIIFQGHDQLENLCDQPKETIIPPEWEVHIHTLLQSLRKRYPRVSDAQLIAAALKTCIQNESRIISNKLKKHL